MEKSIITRIDKELKQLDKLLNQSISFDQTRFTNTFESKKTIQLNAVKNVKITSHQDIIINGDAVDVMLFAKGNVIIKGNCRSELLQSRIISKGDIIAYYLGGSSNKKIILEAGYDFEIREKLNFLAINMRNLLNEQKKLFKALISIRELLNFNDKSDKLESILSGIDKINTSKTFIIDIMEKIKQNIESPSQSSIFVNHIIYPGVEIFINQKHYRVSEILENKCFSIQNNEIVYY